jgi:hypothetical protein
MPNNIAYETVLTDELDKLFVQGPVTGFFADNALRAKFVGAKTVLIPEISLSALANYDRETGFSRGAIDITNQSHTLEMDRARSFQLDREDEDEAGIANLAGQVMGEFIRTKVTPEVDAYCLSKLAGLAKTKSHIVSGTASAENILTLLNTAFTSVQNEVGFDEELVCFVNPTVWGYIQNSNEITRMLVASDFKKGELNTKVKSLNGVAILPVTDTRMKSAYTFGEGFTPASEAQSIGFIVMPKKGASLVKKTEKIRIFSPDQNQSADAYKYDYRVYYDLLVKNSMAGAVYAHTY